jgi:hypothetical protein
MEGDGDGGRERTEETVRENGRQGGKCGWGDVLAKENEPRDLPKRHSVDCAGMRVKGPGRTFLTMWNDFE